MKEVSKKQLKNQFNNLIKNSYSGNFYIVFFDGNGLKRVNDSYGHKMGDYVIEVMQRVIKCSLKPSDLFCRFGGDEFIAILYREVDSEAVSNINFIQERLKSYKGFLEKDIGLITISAGMIQFPKDKKYNFDDALQAADAAMYKAKKASPNFFYYSKDMNLEVDKNIYTRGKDHLKISLRLYFQFILNCLLNKNPKFKTNKLIAIQRHVWNEYGYDILSYSPKLMIEYFEFLYKTKGEQLSEGKSKKAA